MFQCVYLKIGGPEMTWFLNNKKGLLNSVKYCLHNKPKLQKLYVQKNCVKFTCSSKTVLYSTKLNLFISAAKPDCKL